MEQKVKEIGCDECHWTGYRVKSGNGRALSELCDCLSACAECGGAGTVLTTGEDGYTFAAPCPVCGVVRRNVRLYNAAGIPSKYYHVQQVDAGLDPSRMDTSLQKALKYAKSEFVKKYPSKRGFLLMGPSGLGKTHLAIGTISELTLSHGVKCIFKDFFNLLSELRQAYSEGTPENEIIRPLVDTEVLVIDELGKGKSNEWELNILDQLISRRYNASKKTLITTNYVSHEIAGKTDAGKEILELRVGERIASRLYEMCQFLYLEGKDYRKTLNR